MPRSHSSARSPASAERRGGLGEDAVDEGLRSGFTTSDANNQRGWRPWVCGRACGRAGGYACMCACVRDAPLRAWALANNCSYLFESSPQCKLCYLLI